MPHHSETITSPYSPQQLYSLVLDIERYPEFLPWCRAARITERSASNPNEFIGELVISFNHLTERYSSKVVGIPPIPNPQSLKPSEARIDVTLVNGPFSHLTNHWRFVPAANGGTEIHFAVDFKFKSLILEKLIGGLFTKAVDKMATAFLTRADALYGKPL